jgi:hypothetical protein
MKLSEAILRGSTMGPQIRHQLSNGKGTCAWGAAYLALGILGKAITQDLRADPRVIWPWTKTKVVNCPVCWERVHLIAAISDHLNDCHFWTRERIAEWVATIETSEPEVSANALLDAFATFRHQLKQSRPGPDDGGGGFGLRPVPVIYSTNDTRQPARSLAVRSRKLSPVAIPVKPELEPEPLGPESEPEPAPVEK